MATEHSLAEQHAIEDADRVLKLLAADDRRAIEAMVEIRVKEVQNAPVQLEAAAQTALDDERAFPSRIGVGVVTAIIAFVLGCAGGNLDFGDPEGCDDVCSPRQGSILLREWSWTSTASGMSGPYTVTRDREWVCTCDAGDPTTVPPTLPERQP